MKTISRSQTTVARPASAPAGSSVKTRYIVLAAGIGLLIFVLLMEFVLAPQGGSPRSEAELAALQRPHATAVGSPDARVNVVEFLDPACSTCREFYPLVKGLIEDNPGKIRLAIRLVAFHPNSDIAVNALEAAKLQGKFWQVLDNLLASQPRWVIQHRVDPDALWVQLQAMDLDLDKLRADMASPEVANNVARDAQDSKTLKVAATPEYFVNGQGLPEFGFDQLRRLVGAEIAKAYR
ncbi:MAG TPA: thioredoxin domain-containing protein [Casimicrobiaceae bacterium]|nr:thioredoxin domain-containing protein [Casimicrobiaceae bacterium]